MKKFLVLLSVLTSFCVATAVPSGKYYDDRGILHALVSDDGKTIYIFDKEGYVKHELEVTEEYSDGSFSTSDQKTGISHPASANAWFHHNGKVCLNVRWLRYTVTKE
ncbi:MAG: hypothetical protein K2I89_08740 [Muribaculaceae bacterium]|nr:hypothetical protein [Muribaculaceae bacterium]MDE5595642.1 hypothetical protein [Muribaculaceae bacterium]